MCVRYVGVQRKTANVVIDTTVAVKSLLKPARHLPHGVYERTLYS